MHRLQKYIERRGGDQPAGRVAYAFPHVGLPPPREGMSWEQVTAFSAADDLLADPSLKDAIRIALAKGCAIVGKIEA
jgi:hypothetical protein